MKIKRLILFVLTSVVIFALSKYNYATDETNVYENVNENTNTQTQDNEENNTNTENQNNEQNQTENENVVNNNEENNNEETSTQSQENTSHLEQNTTPVVNYNTYIENNNNQQNEVKSNNANLKSLSIDIEGLSPEFNSNITQYYLVIGLDIEEINVQAVAEDKDASVTVTGNSKLEDGQNTIKITVEAENGNTKAYYIYVTKTDDLEGTNANLKTLAVKGWSFYPQFKTNIYSYSLTINEKVSKLDITAETENEEATFKILGNENLQEGDNLIKIIVTAKDGNTSKEYKINTFISSKTVSIKQENKTKAFVLMIILGITIIITAIAIIKKK